MKLREIQQTLKAPKDKYNSFGKYKYRSCESILESVKPLLGDSILTLTDEIVEVGGRIYVKAIAKFVDEKETIVTAFAREPAEKKGMDESQITGTASSYARKYALNGLFLIDDTKDADTDEFHNVTNKKEEPKLEEEDNLNEPISATMQKRISEIISLSTAWGVPAMSSYTPTCLTASRYTSSFVFLISLAIFSHKTHM